MKKIIKIIIAVLIILAVAIYGIHTFTDESIIDKNSDSITDKGNYNSFFVNPYGNVKETTESNTLIFNIEK